MIVSFHASATDPCRPGKLSPKHGGYVFVEATEVCLREPHPNDEGLSCWNMRIENWSPTFSDSPKKSIFPSSFLYQNGRNHFTSQGKWSFAKLRLAISLNKTCVVNLNFGGLQTTLHGHFPGSATISIPGFIHCWDLWWTSAEKKNAPKLHGIFPNLGMSCRKKKTPNIGMLRSNEDTGQRPKWQTPGPRLEFRLLCWHCQKYRELHSIWGKCLVETWECHKEDKHKNEHS